MSDSWEPSDGPPPSQQSKYKQLYVWLDNNPGKWVVIHGAYAMLAPYFRSRGLEATTRSPGDGTYDVYVRKPAE